MSASQQTKIVADYIMANVLGEPSRDEGAGDCAVRLLKEYRAALTKIMRELGVPSADYPTPVANAYETARRALGEKQGEAERLAAEAEKTRSEEQSDREEVK